MRKIWVVFIIFSGVTSIVGDKDYKDRKLIEDFESIKITNDLFQIKANTNYLPDVRMSKNLVSPDLDSKTSLLIRIPNEGTGIPMDLIFKNPYSINDYIINFEFNIYSNQANGQIFLYLLDSHFHKHQILIANLNFDGWKNFQVPIGNKIIQKNYTPRSETFIKFVGIQINTNRKESKGKEDIIAIDDIFILKRKKYDLPKEGLDIFY